MPKPTIAMINGRVGGGGSELCLSCDMRFAGPDAVFNQPEVALGILPGGSGTVRLPRLCGRSRAMEIILGCEDFSGEEAKEFGLLIISVIQTYQQLTIALFRMGKPLLLHRRSPRSPRAPPRKPDGPFRTQRRRSCQAVCSPRREGRVRGSVGRGYRFQ